MMEKLGKILIVDASKPIREAIGNELIAQGFAVEKMGTRADVEHYLAQRNGKTTGVLLMDLCLKDTDGRSLAESIKADPPHVHIMYMTGKKPPLIEGHRVFKKPFKDYTELGNILWGCLKVSNWRAEFDELKSMIRCPEVTACRTDIAQKFSEVAQKLEVVGARAEEAHTKVAKHGLFQAIRVWWKSEDAMASHWAAGIIVALCTAIVALAGILLCDFRWKLDRVTELQIEVRGEIKPTIKKLTDGQDAIRNDVQKVLVAVDKLQAKATPSPSPSAPATIHRK
jgi:CheY-like chemotaxis protein